MKITKKLLAVILSALILVASLPVMAVSAAEVLTTDDGFKYTVGDGKIYMGVDYFTGETNDGVMNYYLDGKNLVIDGVGYAKVESE